ncbi:leucine-rich repeat protein [Ruminococcus flavefaciens]|uniref:Transglutaminase-like domain-containing protein n=2 Tax=Ruminococcus flavefaciens TaxID=1265 RepID=W7UVE7_RUMFL|nr:leucine-rich repeat protein [Ruminococcus flavefaciens]EWM52297.1 hypothetical protein RF007C_13180 [Ruminococcus flavefaciens 007c]
MKKNNKMKAAISIFAAALNVLPVANIMNVSAKEISPAQIRDEVADLYIDLSDSKYDVNGDGFRDYKDAAKVEEYINNLYEEYRNGDSYTDNSDLPKFDVKNGETKYDITGNTQLSSDDYCTYLKAIQQKYRYEVNMKELTATITRYSDKEAETIVVPAEIYDQATDRIYPVANIADGAFTGCTKLTKIEFFDYRIPNWVDEDNKPIANRGMVSASTALKIKKGAFDDCAALNEIVFPSHITIEDGALNQTNFAKNNSDIIDGVKVYRSTGALGRSQTILAYGIENADTIKNGELTIPAAVNAVNETIIGDSVFKDDITSLRFESAPEFIADYAFKKCKNLQNVSVCGDDENNSTRTALVNRYIPAFNGTPFMAGETQKKLDEMLSQIRATKGFDNMTDKEKALLAAKYLVHNTYYRTYSTSNTEFSLYPNNLYHTMDMSREAVYSGHAAMNVRFTECGGISMAYSLILDSLGIQNLLMGSEEHSLNQVRVGEKWYKVDLTPYCDARSTEIRESEYGLLHTLTGIQENIDLTDSEVVSGMNEGIFNSNLSEESTLSVWDEYDLFSNSKGKHIVKGDYFYFIYDDDNNILIYSSAGAVGKTALQKQMRNTAALNYDHIKAIDVSTQLSNKYITASGDKIKIFDQTFWLDENNNIKTNFFDNEFKYHGGNGKTVGTNWIVIYDHYFFLKDSQIALNLNGVYTPAYLKKNGNTIYGYDLNGNKLNGTYFYNDGYYGTYEWVFENGVFISTTAD